MINNRPQNLCYKFGEFCVYKLIASNLNRPKWRNYHTKFTQLITGLVINFHPSENAPRKEHISLSERFCEAVARVTCGSRMLELTQPLRNKTIDLLNPKFICCCSAEIEWMERAMVSQAQVFLSRKGAITGSYHI